MQTYYRRAPCLKIHLGIIATESYLHRMPQVQVQSILGEYYKIKVSKLSCVLVHSLLVYLYFNMSMYVYLFYLTFLGTLSSLPFRGTKVLKNIFSFHSFTVFPLCLFLSLSLFFCFCLFIFLLSSPSPQITSPPKKLFNVFFSVIYFLRLDNEFSNPGWKSRMTLFKQRLIPFLQCNHNSLILNSGGGLASISGRSNRYQVEMMGPYCSCHEGAPSILYLYI